MTEWTTILLLLVVAEILLFFEAVLIPGFGVAGILGIILGVAGWWLAWHGHGPVAGVVTMVVSVGVSVALLYALGRSRLGRRMVLRRSVQSEGVPAQALDALVGKRGTAEAPLRPSGVVRIGGMRYDAVAAEGRWIERGTPVRVVGISTGVPVVIPDEDAPVSGGSDA